MLTSGKQALPKCMLKRDFPFYYPHFSLLAFMLRFSVHCLHRKVNIYKEMLMQQLKSTLM